MNTNKHPHTGVKLYRQLAHVALMLSMLTEPALAIAAKSLIYCSEGSPESFYPGSGVSGITFAATEQIYDSLLQFENRGTKIVPGLAEKWQISKDGMEYTFYLRKGVKWQSNKNFTAKREFNADDAIFMLERQWKENHPYYKVTDNRHAYFNEGGLPEILNTVKKLDDHTILIKINRPEAPFLSNLAMAYTGIQSKEYADAMLQSGTPEKIDTEPLGTGPFQLVQYQRNTLIRYKTFPAHWAGKAKVDDLIFSITPDASVRWLKLQKGECHIASYPSPADLRSMRMDPKIQVIEEAGFNVGYMAYNMTKAPYKDVRIRQAINMAIDKKNILNLIYQGTAIAAVGPLPPTIWGYNTALKDDELNPTEAKKLLASAGYPNGFTTDLWAMPVARSYNPNAKRMAELIQADLAKIGIKVEIKSHEWNEYIKGVNNGEHQMALIGWNSDSGDPDNFLHTLLSCESTKTSRFNVAKFCHLPFDDMVIEAKYLNEQKDREKFYEKAQNIFKQQVPWFTIAHAKEIVSIRKEVVNYQSNPLGRRIFKNVDIRE
jgi:dipeptide transport system substrate-binding protein